MALSGLTSPALSAKRDQLPRNEIKSSNLQHVHRRLEYSTAGAGVQRLRTVGVIHVRTEAYAAKSRPATGATVVLHSPVTTVRSWSRIIALTTSNSATRNAITATTPVARYLLSLLLLQCYYYYHHHHHRHHHYTTTTTTTATTTTATATTTILVPLRPSAFV